MFSRQQQLPLQRKWRNYQRIRNIVTVRYINSLIELQAIFYQWWKQHQNVKTKPKTS